MQSKYNRSDKLVFASETPDIQELQSEFDRSLTNGGNISRINSNDDIRLARWEGQSDDGKKYSRNQRDGEGAFPFEGASDVRVRLVDSIINELVMLLVNSWQLARIRVTGTEYGDASTAASVQTLARWVVENKLRPDLEREAELWAQYALNYGWAVMHVGWERRLGSREVTETLPTLEARATGDEMLAEALRQMVATGASDITADLFANALGCSSEEGRRIANAMLASGVASYNQQYNRINLPVCAALKPYEEISFPPETLDLQEARVIFRRTFMSEVELREMIKTDGWDEAFVEEAANTAGKSAYLTDPNLIPVTSNVSNALHRADNLIEIVYAYSRQIDQNGVPCVYYTVFSPQTSQVETYAKHSKLDYAHGEYPFIELRRERLKRAVVESRGIPEIAFTDQEEIKAQKDSLRDRTAFETLPPIKVKKRLGTQNQIAPGSLLPVTTPDDYSFLSPPSGNPTLAFNLIDRVEAQNAAYFGLFHPAVPPQKTQMTQQFIVNNWLTAWSRVLKQMVSLSVQYLDGSEIERIVGTPIAMTPNEISQMYDIGVSYNVRELDTDYVMEKLKAIASFVVPMDAGGVIDRNKLTARFVEAISPESAKDLLLDQKTASQKLYNDVQTDIAKMMAGMEVQYVENDPTAGAKLQYLQDILQKNPKAQQLAQSDPQFQALMQNYIQNLQMSVQQQQNKTIGRLGVTPVSDKMAQEGQQPGYGA